MGRTPVIGTAINDSCPGSRSSSSSRPSCASTTCYGRRDNIYKARIKILVKAEGQRFVDAVNAEFAALLRRRRHAR